MCHDNEERCEDWRRIEELFFQNWHEKFVKIWPEHLKVSKSFTLMGSFWAKYILIELKKYRRVISHDNEWCCKIWWGIDLSFQNWHEEFDKFRPEHSKVSKMFTLMPSLWAKYICFELKKYKGVIFHNTEKWHRLFVSKLTWEIWKILTWVLESLKDFQFNELLLNKVYIAWDKKVQRSYLSWQRRVIKNAERNWFVVSKLTWEICQILTWALGSLKIFTLTGSFWAKYILFEPEKCR